MLKRLIFCLWILLPFFLFAQNEEAHFTVHDSLTTGKHQGTGNGNEERNGAFR